MAHMRVWRAIWISDVHLGTRACKAESLLCFLRSHMAERLYLVGDIVDAWRSRSNWFWSTAQQAVVDEISHWRRGGAQVVFLPGNHDEHDPRFVEHVLGSMTSEGSLIHVTATGARMLVVHGHQFDGTLNPNRLLPIFGSSPRAHRLDDWFHQDDNTGSSRAVTSFIRNPMKRALGFLTDFRDRAITMAAQVHHADGVICGHIHAADHRTIGTTLYLNDGDWVQSRTAVVEDEHGTLRVVKWKDECEGSQWATPVEASI